MDTSDSSWRRRRQHVLAGGRRTVAASRVSGRAAVRRARQVAADLDVDVAALVALLHTGKLAGLGDDDVTAYLGARH